MTEPNKSIDLYANYQKRFAAPPNAGSNDAKANFFTNIDPGMSIRAPYSRDIYEFYRPDDAIPRGSGEATEHKIMKACKEAYESVGVLRSIIDLMSDFGSDGIRLEHPDEVPQAFYNAWAKKVNLKDRAERLLNWLFKSGNVVIRRQLGTLSNVNNRTAAKIPIRYLFYDPSTVHLVGGRASVFSSEKQYTLYIPASAFADPNFKEPSSLKAVLKDLPKELESQIKGGKFQGWQVPIPKNEVWVGHYKKDDTDIWAKSFIYGVLSDVQYNTKVKMAKISAMDGIINVIRIWAIGDHNKDLYPSPAQFEKLANIIQANTGGGAMDIIWGSDIKMQEFYPPIDRLVNLDTNMTDVLVGIGVPGILLGVDKESASGNPYIGLKNLVQKIQYGRELITDWLNYEIDTIQKEMGFKKRPYIRFNNDNLNDERTYYNFLLQLLDRSVISDTTILERIREIPEIERTRLFAETQMRENGDLPNKAGPFNNPQVEDQRKHEINKIKVQNSFNETNKKANDPKPAGRPDKSKDSYQRTRKNGMRLTRASLWIDASRIYDQLEQEILAGAIDHFGIKDVRAFNSEQKKTLDQSKHDLFPLIDPESAKGALLETLDPDNLKGPIQAYREIYDKSISEVGAEKLTSDQKRILRINAYVEAWMGV